MFKKIFMIMLALGLMASSASANDGEGLMPGADLNADVVACAVDQYGGKWHFTAVKGNITGYRESTSNCVWDITGTYTGLSFHMDLTMTSGLCCESGYADGVADKQTKSATGSLYWTGRSCSAGPYPYIWTVGC